MPNMLPVGGCDHAVSATTCQALLVLTLRVSGAALNQSRSASGVYTGLTSEMPRKDRICFVLPPLFDGDKTHGTRCVFGVPPTRRGHSKTSWSGHGPDTRTLLRLSAARELSGCFDVREGQRQRRLTGGCAHCVITTTFAKWGSLQPVKGSLAPLTRP